MPVSKPTTLPRWATVDGVNPAANVDAPPSGKQDTGFPAGDPVPSSWFNWFLFWIYLWIEYVNDIPNQVFLTNGEAGDTHGARKMDSPPTTRKLVDEINLGYGGTINTNDVHLRVYSGGSNVGLTGADPHQMADVGALEYTINARWTGADWAPDNVQHSASKTVHGNGIGGAGTLAQFAKNATGGGNWIDSAWDAQEATVTIGGGFPVTLASAHVLRDAAGTVTAAISFNATGAVAGQFATISDAWARPKRDQYLVVPVLHTGTSTFGVTVITINTAGQIGVTTNNVDTFGAGVTLFINATWQGA